MAYTVRVRGVEIICDTLDDLDAIVERYGSEGEAPSVHAAAAAASRNGSSGAALSGRSADVALLQTLLEAGNTGVKSEAIGHMIKARGKGFAPALTRWATRVGFSDAESNFPLEPARPEGARGWRLKDGAMVMAKALFK